MLGTFKNLPLEEKKQILSAMLQPLLSLRHTFVQLFFLVREVPMITGEDLDLIYGKITDYGVTITQEQVHDIVSTIKKRETLASEKLDLDTMLETI